MAQDLQKMQHLIHLPNLGARAYERRLDMVAIIQGARLEKFLILTRPQEKKGAQGNGLLQGRQQGKAGGK